MTAINGSDLLGVFAEAQLRNVTDATFHAEVERAALVIYEALRGVNPPQTKRDEQVARTAAAVALYLRDSGRTDDPR